MRRWLLALVTLTLLALIACDSTRKPIVGQQLLRFSTVLEVPAGQTLGRILASTNVGNQVFYAFLLNDGTATTVRWLIETGPASGTGGTGVLVSDLTNDARLRMQAGRLGVRWAVYVLQSGEELSAGFITILPSTLPQFIVSEPQVIRAGDAPGTIGDLQFVSHQEAASAFVAWTEIEGDSVRLRSVELANITNGSLVLNPLYDSGLLTPGTAGLELDAVSEWDGGLLGGYLGSNNAAVWILGRQELGTGTNLASPVAVQIASSTALTAPLSGTGLYAAPRVTELTFTPPPTVELCSDGRDGIFWRDHWITAARGTARIAMVETIERKYNCPDDPEQLLFEGTRWILGGPAGGSRTAQIRPLVLAEGGSQGRIFVHTPGQSVVNVYRQTNLSRFATLDFDEFRTPAGLAVEALTATGREEFGALRVIGRAGNKIVIAERNVDGLAPQT